ncbi:MAG: DUF3786 domain-containing protein [bacterium]
MRRARLNALEVLKQLPRTNCRECRLPTCLAFANQVALGQRAPQDCPYLDPAALSQVRDLAAETLPAGRDEEEVLDELTRAAQHVDYAAVTDALGARLAGEDLVVRCLGREFTVDPQGRIRSQCHANFWVLIPLLDYIAHADPARRSDGSAVEPTGEWIKFDQLGNAMSASDFFSTSCEQAFRRLADDDLDLFSDLLELFGGRHTDQGFEADLSVILHPLPKVPLLFCYWKPEPPFEAKLSVYFDRATDANLSIEVVHILVTGLAEMWKRIHARHTFQTGSPADG